LEPVIFPDVEKVLVAALKAELNSRSEPIAANVTVATIKPTPQQKPYPTKIIVVRSDGGTHLDHVRRMERLGLSIFADTYAEASELARLVEALVRMLTSDEIKLIDVVLSPIRIDEASLQEHRYMTLQIITKGTDLT
jgi:hypothetical protein